jgi:U4/U6.U5 tri-snRNP component SNU23
MAARKEGAYGKAAASDTDFRKTWDVDEYAAKAKAKEDERRDEAKLRYEAKLEGKTYHKYVDPSTLESTSARGARLDVASMVGKSSLVPAGSGIGKRGRGAGFYCEACDLTYKDNVQYIEHLNSKGHLVNTGQSGEVVRATVQDVRDKIDELIVRKRGREEEDRRLGEVDVKARIKGAEEREEKERAERRARRNEKRRAGGGVKREEDGWEERLGVIS